MEIDLVLTWLMPVLIILWFIGIMYFKMKEPADIFLAWIGRGIRALIDSGKERATESVVMESTISYE